MFPGCLNAMNSVDVLIKWNTSTKWCFTLREREQEKIKRGELETPAAARENTSSLNIINIYGKFTHDLL